MILRSYHTHTTHCDGKNSVREMAQAAVNAGMQALGFSGHGTFLHDLRYCIQPDGVSAYVADVKACKEQFAGLLEVYLGVEDDFYGVRPDFQRDYTLGATHYMQKDGIYYYVDYSEEVLRKAIREGFGGDPYAMTGYYYGILAQFPEKMDLDIVAHFDLVTKFNEGGKLFDEEDPRYRKPALEAMEYLCSKGLMFEINTGAMSRGYRTAPYPSRQLLCDLHDFGGSIVLNCDSHSVDTVCSFLPEAAELARACGFRTHRILTAQGWQEVPLGE